MHLIQEPTVCFTSTSHLCIYLQSFYTNEKFRDKIDCLLVHLAMLLIIKGRLESEKKMACITGYQKYELNDKMSYTYSVVVSGIALYSI